MQFPTIPAQKVTPVTRTDVSGVAAVAAVGPGQVSAAGAFPAEAPARARQDTPPPQERRQGSRRRGADRRRQKVLVLLDTRTGRERRGERRRGDDPPPAGVDYSA
jgi:hypothetical protein